jgi:hypothetical protein
MAAVPECVALEPLYGDASHSLTVPCRQLCQVYPPHTRSESKACCSASKLVIGNPAPCEREQVAYPRDKVFDDLGVPERLDDVNYGKEVNATAPPACSPPGFETGPEGIQC